MNVTEVPAHIVVELAAIETVGVSTGLTVIIIVFEVAVTGFVQVALDVITQVTVLPLPSAALTYVGVLLPALLPLSFH